MSSKSKILTASVELFSQEGYSGTSIQKIADKCDISQTTVLYHFRSKKSLFEACLDRVIEDNRERIQESISESDDAKEKLRKFLYIYVHWAKSYPKECQLFLLLYYFACNDEHFKSVATRITTEGREMILDYLKPLRVKSGQSIEAFSYFLQEYVHGVMFNCISTNSLDGIVKSFESQLSHILNEQLEIV